MKLNIFITEPFQFADQNIPLAGLGSLDSLVDDAECEEVRIESLDYFTIDEIVPVIDKLVSKLRHGGTLKVHATDLDDMSRVIAERAFSTEDLNKAIYGTDIPKRSAVPLNELAELVKSCGLKIKKKRLQNTLNYVEAIRE